MRAELGPAACTLSPAHSPDTGPGPLRGHVGRGREREQHTGPEAPPHPLHSAAGATCPPRLNPARAKGTRPRDRLGPTKAWLRPGPAGASGGVESCSEEGQGGQSSASTSGPALRGMGTVWARTPEGVPTPAPRLPDFCREVGLQS